MCLNEAVEHGEKFAKKRDVLFILENVAGFTQNDIFIKGETEFPEQFLQEYENRLKRLAKGEPLQYVLGKWDFCGTEFITDKRALIPRPETELLAEIVANFVNQVSGTKSTIPRDACFSSIGNHISPMKDAYLGAEKKITFRRDLRLLPTENTNKILEVVFRRENIHGKPDSRTLQILDVCTGSGCIGLSVAKLTGYRHKVVLADISEETLDLARENHEYMGIPPNISFVHSDLLERVQEEFDIIVSNPPYIKSHELKLLPENVRNHEPMLALDGGADGLAIYKKLLPQCFVKLKPGGYVFLEIGPSETAHIMEEAGFTNIKTRKDYAGLDRILYAMR